MNESPRDAGAVLAGIKEMTKEQQIGYMNAEINKMMGDYLEISLDTRHAELQLAKAKLTPNLDAGEQFGKIKEFEEQATKGNAILEQVGAKIKHARAIVKELETGKLTI